MSLSRAWRMLFRRDATMKSVYLLLSLSLFALLMVGCASSEQSVSSAPTPDLEATVEAMLEEKLEALATPIQNTSNESTSVLSESLGALPTLTPTPTSIPPAPTATAVPVTKVPVVQVEVAKAAPTAAPKAVAMMPTATPVPPAAMRVIPTPTPAPVSTPKSQGLAPLTDTVTVATILSDFWTDPEAATTKYSNQTFRVSGRVDQGVYMPPYSPPTNQELDLAIDIQGPGSLPILDFVKCKVLDESFNSYDYNGKEVIVSGTFDKWEISQESPSRIVVLSPCTLTPEFIPTPTPTPTPKQLLQAFQECRIGVKKSEL